MSLAALIAFLKANDALILSLWVVLEQYLAADKKLKANSTLQLVMGIIDTLIKGVKKDASN